MEQTWDSLDSRQKISVATLVCLHFGIPLLAEDLACMTMNGLNTPGHQSSASAGSRSAGSGGPDEPHDGCLKVFRGEAQEG